mmetsp:Transcript_20654/g.31355  ORF Transcript_20654/g.31355 Transcript_20654/m.31355 type:complete len:170 (+) Transcript_20654:128-637(+)
MPCRCGKKSDVVDNNAPGPRHRRNSVRRLSKASLTELDDLSHPDIHMVHFRKKLSASEVESGETSIVERSSGDNADDELSRISSLSFESASSPNSKKTLPINLGTPVKKGSITEVINLGIAEKKQSQSSSNLKSNEDHFEDSSVISEKGQREARSRIIHFGFSRKENQQ